MSQKGALSQAEIAIYMGIIMNVLSQIMRHNEIVIQCHDNPDPDAIASGFALYQYLYQSGKKNIKLIYSGNMKMTKVNIICLAEQLHIPILYVSPNEELGNPELLVTVDCQYGTGNVTKFSAQKIATIDHHQIENDKVDFMEINSNLASCSTLMWFLLKEEGFLFDANEDVATALYYGLLCDSNSFSELNHPLDKDLRDGINYDEALIRKLKNTNLTQAELQIASEALSSYNDNQKYRYTIFEAAPCDPNILGFISDIALQVDSIDVCVVYNQLPTGIKLSIRSSVKEVQASELAGYITSNIGNGGGHLEKAGGFISLGKFHELYSCSMNEYLSQRLERYFAGCEIIDSRNHSLKPETMSIYRKKNILVQYVKSTDVWKAGTPITIRTLECDMDIIVAEDIYIIIGMKGEVYPIKRDKFERSYEHTDMQVNYPLEYFPTAKDRVTNKAVSLQEYASSCIATGGVEIYAEQLEHRTKVFTAWDKLRYMHGKKGDYIAIRKDDLQDVYIIDKTIFKLSYELC